MYGTALAAAAYSGNEKNLQLLFDLGANIGAEGGYSYGTTFSTAAYSRQEKTVQLLLYQPGS